MSENDIVPKNGFDIVKIIDKKAEVIKRHQVVDSKVNQTTKLSIHQNIFVF